MAAPKSTTRRQASPAPPSDGAAAAAAASTVATGPKARRAKKSGGGLSLLATWNYWSAVPLIGRWLFGWLLAFASPYTGTLSLSVDSLSAGVAKTHMKEWWLLRNPFRSVHAAALLNMGEATGGLAVVAWCESQPVTHRAIVTRLEIDFFKKARGRITGVCELDPSTPLLPPSLTKTDARVVTDLLDASGALVARTTAVWTVERIDPKDD
ncbi:hypothetical protein BC831DRAFT_451876 [Entophlyctis helioformis]|nr:hypothetical protein BC831DRAFT_451876 [Entophlyctis helioformis]